ncbi:MULTISPECIES: DUF6286 domain-containing protein [Actinosynnema]|uniref:DUF6286 domain-containing protein n=2 Tax=Actinosynnema TaxID=40566 RepID=C6WP61_ACTMD|nr:MULTISPECIES: DUF6286 domain-containing protein [Actinosynnema]ACU36730.1 hypothetical protein Amir_2798 [Actinosynnema mirum DSM 43827]AXX30190.1 hypothetical protein APASM_2825 [Actinosynnema pretiosum subsp. pretiosum]MCP2092152.1 hypothetical protein [Actinosynnema pretiosum]QUF05654.1 hypothetical protein KCV87_06025 [Actinosynnema pretiosum subsp. pretiosum]
MKRLPRRSAPAVLVALAVLAACALVTTVAVRQAFGLSPWIDPRAVAGALHGARWTDPLVVLAASVCAVLGAVLLLCALLPGAPTVLPLRDDDPDSDHALESGVTRRSLRNVLRATASSVDGVTTAKLALTRRAATATATTDRTGTTGLADAVRVAVAERLDRVGPLDRPTVTVRLKAGRAR